MAYPPKPLFLLSCCTYKIKLIFKDFLKVSKTNSSCPSVVYGLCNEFRQGTEQMRTFDPTNESTDCWSAVHTYLFNIRVKIDATNKEYSDWLGRNQ